MCDKFENTLLEEFGKLCPENIRVIFQSCHIFLCGGEVNGSEPIPTSFRHRLLIYSSTNYEELHDYFIEAEKFKDYFKDNNYPDLLVFETDIANISSLIIILLESPGALVEFGMFCNKPEFFKKLLVVAPQHEVEGEDSFIYLGPIEFIRNKEPTSVEIYPWPDKSIVKYDDEHLKLLCEQIRTKIENSPKSERFNQNNSAHLALLIHDIIRLSYPVLLGDIEIALAGIGISINQSVVNRLLYLLCKLEMIDHKMYSRYKYYYPTNRNRQTIKYGKNINEAAFDEAGFKMKILQSYVLSTDEQSRKRSNVLKQIKEQEKRSEHN